MAPAADLARCDGKLEGETVVIVPAISQHRQRQRRLETGGCRIEHALDRKLHIDRQNSLRRLAIERLSPIEKFAGNAARSEDRAVGVDDQHAGETVGDHLLERGA